MIERANGTFIGLFHRSKVDLGNDDVDLVMEPQSYLYQTDQMGALHVIGSRADTAVMVVGAAASRSLTLGGGRTGADYGQGGASGGSNIQRPIVRTIIVPCEMQVSPSVVPVMVETKPVRSKHIRK